MTRWSIDLEIWWLEPQRRLVFEDGSKETGAQFASRIQSLIAETAGLKPLSWDGYLKHFNGQRDILKYLKKRQLELANKIKSDF